MRIREKSPEYVRNPFPVLGIEQRTINVGAKNTGLVAANPQTGEELYPIVTMIRKANVDHDNVTFVKVFRQDIRSFSSAARDILWYILYHIKVNSDLVVLKADFIREWTGLSRNKYYAAMNELEGKVIARVEGSTIQYFINPNYFYNGNRVNLNKRSGK